MNIHSRSCSAVLAALAAVLIMGFPARSWTAGGFVENVPPLSGGVGGPDVPSISNPFAESYAPLWAEVDDPLRDGWDTEAFNDAAGNQLKVLGKLIVHPEKIDGPLTELATDDFRCGPLRPASRRVVYEDKTLRIQRGSGGTEEAGAYQGPQGLGEALLALAQPFTGAGDLRFKFKIFRVEKIGGMVVTRQYFAVSGRTPEGMLEQNATWEMTWQPGGDGVAPRLAGIAVRDFEEVLASSGAGPLFTDCTEAALGKNDGYGKQLLAGFAHWLEVIENTEPWALLGTPGIAVGDVDGDDLEDLFLCQEHGLPNMLFLHRPDGTVDEVSRDTGVDWLQSCRSPLLVDLDNDGDQDLVVGSLGNLVLAANDGTGRFSVRALLPTPGDTMSVAAADYDNDGDLDLYVAGYHQDRVLERTEDSAPQSGAASTFVYHDANNGAANILFRNDTGDPSRWVFSDVTEQSGLGMNNHRFSFAVAWEDYDNDGDQDLYVANDYGRDNLYRNDPSPPGGRRFVDVGGQAGAEDNAGGMSVSWGDYDRDGWMDVFVSNMWSSAGNRVTYQPQFKPGAPEDIRRRFQGFARGNTLLHNRADGTFEDVSAVSGVEMGRWAWGSRFVDINNDGWEDLVVANGYLTGDPGGGDL